MLKRKIWSFDIDPVETMSHLSEEFLQESDEDRDVLVFELGRLAGGGHVGAGPHDQIGGLAVQLFNLGLIVEHLHGLRVNSIHIQKRGDTRQSV